MGAGGNTKERCRATYMRFVGLRLVEKALRRRIEGLVVGVVVVVCALSLSLSLRRARSPVTAAYNVKAHHHVAELRSPKS